MIATISPADTRDDFAEETSYDLANEEKSMQRDMDLVRHILLAVEAGGAATNPQAITADGHSQEVIHYHVRLCVDAGLLTDPISKLEFSKSNRSMRIMGNTTLTWAGHEFLDAAREDGRWEAAKAASAKVGTVGLDAIKSVLVQLATKALQAQLGL